jgi:predicted transcriptional regulator YheO
VGASHTARATSRRLGVGQGGPRMTAERRMMLETLAALAAPLAAALGDNFEVVVHSLDRLPNSIVAIAGNLTGRGVGGPMTDLLLQRIRVGDTQNFLRYRTTGRRAQQMISSTIFIKDGETPVACLCINTDIGGLEDAQRILSSLTEASRTVGDPDLSSDGRPSESFPQSIEELTRATVQRMIEAAGVPVELMQRQHKMEVVAELERHGIFLIRDSVGYVAQALGVTRYTIYNYLNSLRGADGQHGLRDSAKRRLPAPPLGPRYEA